MSGQQLTLLVPKSAREAHAELLAALGSENNPAQWMAFMDAVTKLLPDVLSSGRPSKEAIQKCAVGQLGFSSWQEMIEAPTEANGLGWNFSGWKAWRRAWTTVQAYPWLRNEAMTSSEVNTITQECKQDGVQFPGSAEELEAIRKGRKDAQEARRTESTKGLTQRAEAAETAAQEAKTAAQLAAEQLTLVQGQLAQALTRIEEQAEVIGTLKAEKAEVETNRDLWKSRYEKNPKPTQLTRLQHFLISIGLRSN